MVRGELSLESDEVVRSSRLAMLMRDARFGFFAVLAIQLWQLRGILHAKDLEMADTAFGL